jgi:hypothetical protein
MEREMIVRLEASEGHGANVRKTTQSTISLVCLVAGLGG